MYLVYKILFILAFTFVFEEAIFSQAHTHSNGAVDIRFIENKGQFEDQVAFKAELPDGYLFMGKTDLTYLFFDGNKYSEIKHFFTHDSVLNCHAFKVDFIKARDDCRLSGKDLTPEYYNYFIGNNRHHWASGVRGFFSVDYKELYDSIDAEVTGYRDQLKYTFNVKPGGNPSDIRLKYTGLTNISVEDDGLHVFTSLNEMVEMKPYAYQVIDGKNVQVPCNFGLYNHIVSFNFPNGYNLNIPLVIDPVVIFASFSGSVADNFGYTATYDTLGFAYSGGTVFDPGFPVTLGAFQMDFHGGNPWGNPGAGGARDVGILKYTPDGKALVYATYLGGSGNEDPHSMVVNHRNELIVFGNTDSPDFPIGNKFYDSSYNRNYDIYLAKFSTNGKTLLASTYVGDTNEDGLNGYFTSTYINQSDLGYNYGDCFRGEVNIDKSDNVFVITTTKSINFPVTPAVFQPVYGGGLQDAVLFKMSPNLDKLLKSSFLGGNNDDAGYGIAFDHNENIYVCGGTKSTNLPVTKGKYQTTYRGGYADGFIFYISKDFSKILAGTYFGTDKYDQTYFIQTDRSDNVYVTGQTISDSFPVRNVKYYNAFGKQFISKLNPGLDSIVFSTVFGAGGSGSDPNLSPSAFLVDDCERIYFSGWGGEVNNPPYSHDNNSTNGLPVTPDGYQQTTDGSDFYLAVFARNMDSLMYATFFGGSISREHVDGGTSRFDKKGVVYEAVCGGCGGYSDFPTTPGAWSRINKGHRPGSTLVDGCNNAIFKIDMFIPDLLADFNVDTIFCLADSTHIKNLSHGANVFLWKFGDGKVSTGFEPKHHYADTGLYKITLISSNAFSCVQVDTITKYIYVYNQAASNFTYDSSQCVNNIEFHATSKYAKRFSWNFGDQNFSTLTDPVHFYKDSGTYNVTFISDSGSICQNIVKKKIFIGDLPNAHFTFIVDTCRGKAVFTNLSTNSKQYYWDFGDHSFDTISNPSHFYKRADSFRVLLIAEYGKICADSEFHYIKITWPKADAILDLDTCYFFVKFQNSSRHIADKSAWYFGDGDSNYFHDTISHRYDSSGKYKIMLIANIGTICLDTVYRTLTIPSLPVSLFNFRRATCSAFAHFYNKSLNASTFSWDFGNGSTSASRDSVIAKYLSDSNFVVRLIAISPHACRDTSFDTIHIAHLAYADFGYRVDTCTKHIYFLNHSSHAAEYNWDFGDNSGSSKISPDHNYDSSGKYLVKLSVKDSACVDSVVKEVFIYQPPLPEINLDMDSCLGWVYFKSNSAGVLKYFWEFGDGSTSQKNNPKHQYNSSGSYQVVFYINKDTLCSDSIVKKLDVTNYAEDSIVVPNVFSPNHDQINDIFVIRGLNYSCDRYKIYVYNRWGQLVYESPFNHIEWDGTCDGKTLDEGTYYYVLQSNYRTWSGTITIIR